MIAKQLKFYKAKNIVVDPVMVSTSGCLLMENDALETLKTKLLPLASLVTPNIFEAKILSGLDINNEEDMIKAAKCISEEYNCAVLVKGGHNINDANDLLYMNKEYSWFMGERINNSNTHGTGCTLSSAIASNLAKGFDMSNSIKRAKDYISKSLLAMLDLGKGQGPLNHAFALNGEFAKQNF